jgi:hypothetical protein
LSYKLRSVSLSSLQQLAQMIHCTHPSKRQPKTPCTLSNARMPTISSLSIATYSLDLAIQLHQKVAKRNTHKLHLPVAISAYCVHTSPATNRLKQSGHARYNNQEASLSALNPPSALDLVDCHGMLLASARGVTLAPYAVGPPTRRVLVDQSHRTKKPPAPIAVPRSPTGSQAAMLVVNQRPHGPAPSQTLYQLRWHVLPAKTPTPYGVSNVCNLSSGGPIKHPAATAGRDEVDASRSDLRHTHTQFPIGPNTQNMLISGFPTDHARFRRLGKGSIAAVQTRGAAHFLAWLHGTNSNILSRHFGLLTSGVQLPERSMVWATPDATSVHTSLSAMLRVAMLEYPRSVVNIVGTSQEYSRRKFPATYSGAAQHSTLLPAPGEDSMIHKGA